MRGPGTFAPRRVTDWRSVTAATLQDLYPVRHPLGDEAAQVAALKGSECMMSVLQAAVDSQYRVPSAPIPLEVDGPTVWLRPDAVRAARQRARDTGEPHNQARDQYCAAVLDDLINQMRSPDEPVGGEDLRLRRLLAASPDLRREVNLCWMPRTPEQLLERLYADEGFRSNCTASWPSAQRLPGPPAGSVVDPRRHRTPRPPRRALGTAAGAVVGIPPHGVPDESGLPWPQPRKRSWDIVQRPAPKPTKRPNACVRLNLTTRSPRLA